jgi:hypothetical protein
MKGIASWIWVIGSVIFGMLLFYAGYVLISGQINGSGDSLMLGEISNLEVELDRLCVSEGIGAQKTRDISLPESVKAVYIARSEYSPPPDKVSALISNADSGIGNYLCYQLSATEANIPKKCWNISCTINFTYLGTPTQKKTLVSMLAGLTGKTPIYNYRLTIMKTGEHNLTVSAETILKRD